MDDDPILAFNFSVARWSHYLDGNPDVSQLSVCIDDNLAVTQLESLVQLPTDPTQSDISAATKADKHSFHSLVPHPADTT